MTRCIGFGEFARRCENHAGSTHSKLWCQRCDDLRLKSIDADIERLIQGMEEQKRLYVYLDKLRRGIGADESEVFKAEEK